MPRGGPRPNSGRPRGRSNAAEEVKNAAREHTQTALDALVEVASDKSHSQRVRAAEAILARGYGAPRPEPIGADIVQKFADGEISAIAAALALAVKGVELPKALEVYVSDEFHRFNHVPLAEMATALEQPPTPLPRQ